MHYIASILYNNAVILVYFYCGMLRGSLLPLRVRPVQSQIRFMTSANSLTRNTRNHLFQSSRCSVAAARRFVSSTPFVLNDTRVVSDTKANIPEPVFSKPLLSNQDQQLIQDEQNFLKDFLRFVKDIDAPKADLEIIETSLNQLDKLFSLVVVGEFNSGKSSFLNALLGHPYLDQGITPTTQKIGVIKYGDSFYKETESAEIDSIYLPIDWLKEINVVDTPGTNAIVRSHEAITETFIPQSDLILFVTSVERPFSESERLFLKRIQTWSKKVIVIITKIDQLAGETELIQVTDFVRKNYAELTRSGAMIFPVSSRTTMEEKTGKPISGGSLDPKFNQFKDLEKYIHQTLDAAERLQLKLSTPLGICTKLLASYRKKLDEQLELTRGDRKLLKDINEDIEIFQSDMKRGMYHNVNLYLQCIH